MEEKRWKPEVGEKYWFVFLGTSNGVSGWRWSNDKFDKRMHSLNNCFKTEAEAEAAAEKITALLLSLRGDGENLQPTCNQLATDLQHDELPKLTADVFDRPDCPEWAEFAAVDGCRKAMWYEGEPKVVGSLFWNSRRGQIQQIPGKFDASDWKNSLVERPAMSLPDWCKVGEWIWDDRNGYGEIKSVRDDRSACYIEFKGGSGDFVPDAFAKLKEARLMSYDHLSISEALGKAVSNESAVGIVTGYDIATVRVFGKFIPFNVFRGSFRYLDGSPCGKLLHKDGDDWVE